MNIVVVPQAADEFGAAAADYDDKQPGLGQRFRDEVDRHIRWITQHAETPRLRPSTTATLSFRSQPRISRISRMGRNPLSSYPCNPFNPFNPWSIKKRIPWSAASAVCSSLLFLGFLAGPRDGQAATQLAVWGYSFGSMPAEATNLVAMAAGDDHIVALRADGRVFAWAKTITARPTCLRTSPMR